ncbi:hypothetical protein UPYG_G00085210 [Umbra pygmaea]|uniref:Genetic suppressor element-like domain-containing protein n=1 Tax=Umbra pygmaea TaxID=75934 RepID=A0ABD0XEL4_UMBPY
MREKELQASKAIDSHYLAELHAMRGQEDRTKPERLTPNRPDQRASLPAPKPPQANHIPSPVPGLVSTHGLYLGPGGVGAGLTAAMMLQRTNEEERWMARQRKLRQEKEDRQYQVSEFRQQVLEQHLELGRPGDGGELRSDTHRSIPNHHDSGGRDHHPHLGAPPPLISPKPSQSREHAPPPTTLWNPAALIDSASDSRRGAHHDPPGLGHYDLSRLPPGVGGPPKLEDGFRRVRDREGGMEKYQPSHRGPSEPSTYLAELEKSTQSFFSQQRASLSLPSQYGEVGGGVKSGVAVKSLQGTPGMWRQSQGIGPESGLMYDEFLQQHRRPVSKLDLEERRRREAREKGYYYELDDSYDESDEEEVRAHLRRVSEQPPLKLNDSTEKVEFLCVFGLTTKSRRDQLVQQKRRKRRRMLRERSPSPPAVQSKRTPPPAAPLRTRFTPEEMDRAPELEDKKRFLTMFSLSHVTIQQRRDNDRVVELLHAINRKSVTLDTIRHAPHPLCKTPPAQSTDPASAPPTSESDEPLSARPSSPPSPAEVPGQPKNPTPSEPLRPKDPVPLIPYPDKTRGLPEAPASRRSSSSLLNSLRPPLQPKEAPPILNGRTKTWESFTPEEFAQQFHESVLQSTQKALQKHKGGATVISEPSHPQDTSVHYNIPELQSAPSWPPPPHTHAHAHSIQHPHSHAHTQPNGQHCPPQPHREPIGLREELSVEEESEEESGEEPEEELSTGPRWQGIEAIFEAYQEYIEEQSVERQVLQSQCRRLEAQHYNLSLTAEQLSHSMGDLMSQRQKLAVEREKLQAELEHFRKCLTLPQAHWARGGHYKGYPPR